MDVLDARAVRFKHLYLLGVNEKAFPQLTFDRCFITESDRAAWGPAGVVLDKRSDLIGREMLLFYLSATRADETLNVSYLADGDSGARGVFVTELIASARRDGITVAEKHISPGQFVPPIDQIATPLDAFNAAISAAFDGDNAHELIAFSKRNYNDILRRASFGLVAAHRRWAQRSPDEFDGRINSPTLLKNLAERIPEQWIFSASELNSYAACGWGFFAKYLLRLAPLAAPSAQLAPADRGIFCHAVLWRVMTTLAKNSDGVNLAKIDPDELFKTLGRACLAEKNRLADSAVYSQLWDAQTAYWQRLMWNYLSDQQEAFGKKPTQSLHFELGFGMARYRDEDTDPASRPDPVQLKAGGYQIRLRGKIDRVDMIACKDALATLAVDYKTGQLPTAKNMADYRDLQLALYAKALEAMFDLPCAGGAYHDLRNNKHRYFATYKAKEEYAELLAGATEAVGRYVGAMRRGLFDAIPAGKCSKWCPYRQICQYSQARANRKVNDE
jgi:ATP-dependent helicase/DNAse subunit B